MKLDWTHSKKKDGKKKVGIWNFGKSKRECGKDSGQKLDEEIAG